MPNPGFHETDEACAMDVCRFALCLNGRPAEAEEFAMAVFCRAWDWRTGPSAVSPASAAGPRATKKWRPAR